MKPEYRGTKGNMIELSILTLKDALRQQEEYLKDLQKEAKTRAEIVNEKEAVFLLNSAYNLKTYISDYKHALSVLKDAEMIAQKYGSLEELERQRNEAMEILKEIHREMVIDHMRIDDLLKSGE